MSERGKSLALEIERLCGPLRFTDPGFKQKCIVRQIYWELRREIITAREPCLLLTGPGGVGKSTFVNWLTYGLLERAEEIGYLPLLVEIPQLSPDWERQVILPQDALIFVLEGAGTAMLAALEGLRPREARKRPGFVAKLKRIAGWIRDNLGRIRPLASFVDKAGKVVRGVLGLAPAAASVALAGLPLPVNLAIAAILAAFSLKEAVERVKKEERAFEILSRSFSSLLVEIVRRARKEVPGLKGILLIVDEAGDVRLDSVRATLLEGLALLAKSLEVCREEGVDFKVLVVRREFKTVRPHERVREIRALTRDERDIVEERYRVLEFKPLLSEEQEEFILKMARQLGLKFKKGEERAIARELWGRYLGCPRTICMALVLASHNKGSELIELSDVEAIPLHEKGVYRAVLRKSMELCPCGPERPENMVFIAACAPEFTRRELCEALTHYRPDLAKPRGDLDRAFDFLVEEGFLSEIRRGELVLEDGREVEFVFYALKPGEPHATNIRRGLLSPRDRADIHASWVRALKAVAERQKATLGSIATNTHDELAWHAVRHLEESREASLEPDEQVLAEGLEAVGSLSTFYYERGLPGPCARVAHLGIQLARALDRPLGELFLTERLARFALNVGLPLRRLEELVRRAEELVIRVGEEKPGEADRARYYYCYIAGVLARRLRGDEGLELLERVEHDYANKIADECRRLDAKEALDYVRAELLMELGRLDDAETVIRRRLERARILRERGYLSERSYRQRMAVIENDLGELLFRRGRPEDLEEAIEHIRASRQHCKAIGDERGVAASLANEAMCLLALGGPERAREALEPLSEALRTFSRIGDWQGCRRSLRFMSFAHLALGDDDMALERAVETLRIAYGGLADMPYELADSWLIMAYA
ncbi:hypothetical protein DRO33_04600, partial [Candidatus Bathyarchaeota archaeon]